MMDPWTALGTAAAILQLIDYAAKFLKTTKQIYDQETDEVIATFWAATSRIAASSQALADRPRRREGSSAHISHEEEVRIMRPTLSGGGSNMTQKVLDSLIVECTNVANELIACLNKLTVDHNVKIEKRIWRSVFVAVRTIWDESKIKDLQACLERCRQQVANQILVLLNAKVEVQSLQQKEGFDRLDQGHKDIVEVLLINQDVLMSELAGQRAEFRRQFKETTAAILKWQDGQIRTIIPSQSNYHRLDAASRDVVGQDAVIFRKPSVSDVNQLEPQSMEGIRVDYVPQRILSCLYFRQITDRFEEIAAAHKQTFNWIFVDAATEGRPWDSFTRWLETGSGCYWISGKAGSGKSTLMKYIQSHQRTREALSIWAGSDSELVTASYFFWSLGSGLQKTQPGLLRSLMFDVLEKHQDLIPTLFPGLCRTAFAATETPMLEVSYIELKKAFWRLTHKRMRNIKLCFFIDGVDEYEGDHNELCELITSVSTSPFAKIVTSSREIPACVAAFSAYPRLRLQDLTYGDMKLYVNDHLGKHRFMRTLETLEGNAAREFVGEIASKASGVFLWLMLVVRSLVSGLQNSDRIVDLRRRLDELPEDLSKLYQHMLGKMSPRYQEEAAQIIQITLVSTSVQSNHPLTLLQLSFAEQNPRDAISTPMKVLSEDEKMARCEAMEGRIRSRCCGLVEAQGHERGHELNDGGPNWQVGFLHKTVVEFLHTEAIWHSIIALTANSDFDPSLALLSSCLYEIKICPMTDEISLDSNRAFIAMGHALNYARAIEIHSAKNITSMIDELERCISQHWLAGRTVEGYLNQARSKLAIPTQHMTWPAAFLGMEIVNAQSDVLFLTLVTFFGLNLYVREILRRGELDDAHSKAKALAQTLFYFFEGRYRGDRFLNHLVLVSFAEAAAALLESGADPNLPVSFWDDEGEADLYWGDTATSSDTFWRMIKSCSTWEFVLAHLLQLRGSHRIFFAKCANDGLDILTSMIENFISAGADLNLAIPSAKSIDLATRRSPLRIVQRLDPVFRANPTGMKEGLVKFPSSTVSRIAKRMIEEGAESREWENDRVTVGPPEPRGVFLGRPKHRSVASALAPPSADSRPRSSSRSKISRFIKNIVG
jgi:hypothetical protein